MLLRACGLPARFFRGKPTSPEHLEEAALSEGLLFPPWESEDTGVEADLCCLAVTLEEPAS